MRDDEDEQMDDDGSENDSNMSGSDSEEDSDSGSGSHSEESDDDKKRRNRRERAPVPQRSRHDREMEKRARGRPVRKHNDLDPMDPSSYSDLPRGKWSAGLDKRGDAKTGADTTASGPLYQMRPYPNPGAVLRMNHGKKSSDSDE